MSSASSEPSLRSLSSELHQLRTFRVVAEEENVSRAADLRRKAATLNEALSGTLRIGINNPPESLFLPELIGRLGGAHPGLRFEYSYGNSQSVLTGLRRETFDVGFFETERVPTEIEAEPLEERELILIAPSAWAKELCSTETVGLQGYPWLFASEGCSLFRFARDWCASRRLRVEPQIRSDNADGTTVNLVARELGLSIVARESLAASPARTRVVALPHLSGTIRLSFGYRKDRSGDARITAAAVVIRSLFGKKDQSATNSPGLDQRG